MKDTVLAFNRELAKELGVSAALLYQELQRKFFYWQSQGKLNNEGMFWCDQGEIADWILVHPNTVSKAAKDLEDAGLIKKKVSYRPGTVTPTTWWGLLKTEITPNVDTRNHNNCENHIKANTKANTDSESGKCELAVRVEKWDFDSKGNWKRKRTVYTTVDEADKVEEAGKDEYVTFGFWPSPTLVGRQDKMKTMSEKKTKLKTEYPEPEEKTEKKTGGYMEGISW